MNTKRDTTFGRLHVRTFPPPDRAGAVDAAGRAGFGPHGARPRGNAARRYPDLRHRRQGHGELPGDALGVTATADGARLRCGFQKLDGHATPEGLWLESTKPGGGQLRLVAVAVGRGGSRARPCALTEAASSGRSGMSIVTVPQGDQAPLGAPCTHDAASFFDMPLLTELETPFSDVPFYRHAAPNGAPLATGRVCKRSLALVRFLPRTSWSGSLVPA